MTFVEPPGKIAILGAGPIGLEAALYARYLGYAVDVFERGEIADHVRQWGHVRLFSPFAMNSSSLGLSALAAQDENYRPPAADALLTGNEWVSQYLLPLAGSDLVADSLHLQSEVVAVGRAGPLKGELIGQEERGESEFRLLVRSHDGQESYHTAEAVIDTTGSFGNHNHLGQGGLPALGEYNCESHIEYGVPDVNGSDQSRFAGKHTLVVGAGYSAATNVVALASLADDDPATRVTWITRREGGHGDAGPLRRIADDRLPSRDKLAAAANLLATQGEKVAHHSGTFIQAISHDDTTQQFAVKLEGKHSEELVVDNVIANVGYRPQMAMLDELQVHRCYASDGPMKLAAALLGETSADCLDQQSHGAETLLNPEPNFYILGSKSFGRSSQFLVSLGLSQIRDVFTLIADRESLDLYKTMETTTT